MVINNYEINSKKEIDEVSIIHLSDIHFHEGFNLKIFKNILKEIHKIKPTYVCITGDLLDDNSVMYKEKIKYFIEFIKNIQIKTFIIFGNHDEEVKIDNFFKYNKPNKLIDELKKIDTVYLSDYSENGINFILYNIPFKYYQTGEKDKTLIKLPKKKDGLNILLSHTPIPFTDFNVIRKNNIDVSLFGHMHSGMVPNFIKGHVGIINPRKKLFPKFSRGRINKGDRTIIISGGITKLAPRAGILKHLNFIYCSEMNKIVIKPTKK